jgi:predicted peroxiredoxin
MFQPNRKSLVTIIFSAAAILWATGCQSASPRPAGQAPRDGVFIHISKGEENPHAVLMALRMATLMSADRDVLVYFDLKGVNVVLKDSPDLTFAPFDSSQAQLKGLIDKRIPIYVCPGCLKAAGKTPDDVRPGVKIAEKEAFFNFTKGRILTLDY